MKLVHVVPHVDAEAAGPSYSVPRLCETLAARGHEVALVCLAARDIAGVRVELHRQWPVLERFAVSPGHAFALRRAAAEVDIVHNHSLWSMVNVAAGWVVPARRARLVASPRGTLSRWALGRRRTLKRMLWPLQRRVLARADLLHATSEAEYEDIRSLHLAAPVAVVPNGVDLPQLRGAQPVQAMRTLLFLSRIHPTKALDRLLRAWADLQALHPDWRLRIAGHGEPRHVAEAAALARELHLQRVEFAGALYGAEKSDAYFAADLFVLPTHSENFGMAVAEALAHGVPAVVARGAPWAGLETERCGWWVDNDVATLAGALDAAMREPRGRLGEMGMAGRRWMERDFSWNSVAERIESAYRWTLGGAPQPSCVRGN
ncbi:glycosyltransferase [Dokdonella sp.]|uniref:glycosyltransferase n=1 Tax=Dokdonella sp. TaxID=2291710 RepID=UPI002F3FD661